LTENKQQPATKVSDFPRIGEVREKKQGLHYASVQLGAVAELRQYGVRHPAIGKTIQGKVFLKELLGLTGMEISFGVLPAYTSVAFLHKHRQNEEVYLFLQGQGQIQIDGDTLDVAEGTAVRVAPEGVRCWQSTSAEDLFYIVIQAKEGSLTTWTGSDGVPVSGAAVWPT
jgi:mannose-6-phosphate isomerase-like protein (cupin superfamily)